METYVRKVASIVLAAVLVVFGQGWPALAVDDTTSCGGEEVAGKVLPLTPAFVSSLESKLDRLERVEQLSDDLKSALKQGDYTILDGYREDGVEEARLNVGDRSYVLSTSDARPDEFAFAEIEVNEAGTALRTDALAKDEPSSGGTVTPSGYYGKGCVAWNTGCLKRLVKTACNSGVCGFVTWNPTLTVGCLTVHCGVGVTKCCKKWSDGYWHEW